jgi:hypothetical protein
VIDFPRLGKVGLSVKMNIKGFSLAAGIIWGLAVLVVTLVSFWQKGEHIGILSHIYLGYSVSVVGSIVGLVYGLATGLIAGACFAWLYNKLTLAD